LTDLRTCRTPHIDYHTSRVAYVRENLGLTWSPADPVPLSLAQASSLYVPSPLPSGSVMRLSCQSGSIVSSSTCKFHQHQKHVSAWVEESTRCYGCKHIVQQRINSHRGEARVLEAASLDPCVDRLLTDSSSGLPEVCVGPPLCRLSSSQSDAPQRNPFS